MKALQLRAAKHCSDFNLLIGSNAFAVFCKVNFMLKGFMWVQTLPDHVRYCPFPVTNVTPAQTSYQAQQLFQLLAVPISDSDECYTWECSDSTGTC